MPGAEECVATQPLARAVEDRLGRTVFVSAADADVSVEGRIDGAPKSWRATITIRDAKGALLGTRELSSDKPSCDSLRDSLALVIAVMIDPAASSRPKPAPSQTAAPTATGLQAPPVVVVQREEVLVPAEKPSPPAWRFDSSIGVAAGAGLVPSPYAGLYAGFILTPPYFTFKPPLAVGLEGYGMLLLDADADAAPGAKATLGTALFGSSLCPIQFFERWGSFSMCGGGQLGAMRVRGRGFDADKEKPFLLVNLAGGLRASVIVMRPVVVRATVDGILPLLRDRFSYLAADGATQQVFQASPVAMAATLGLGVQF